MILAIEKFYNFLKDVYTGVSADVMFFIFTAVLICVFLYCLLSAKKMLRGFSSAFRETAEYLKEDTTTRISKKNYNYFYNNYLTRLPLATQVRVAVYFDNPDCKPSKYITENTALREESICAKKKFLKNVYDLTFVVAFLLVSAVSLLKGVSVFAIVALCPAILGFVLRFFLHEKYFVYWAEILSEFNNFVESFDLLMDGKNGKDAPNIATMKKAANLIETILKEEVETQYNLYEDNINKLQKELRKKRLNEVVENVSIICANGTSVATLIKVFDMITEAKQVYKEKEETEILNECLVKLKNAISRIENT